MERRDNIGMTTEARQSSRAMRSVWPLLILLLTSLLVPGSALAQSELPAFRAPMLDTPATPAAFRNGLGGSTGANTAPVTDEIKELARGLRYDPGNMYKFVHDYVEWEPTWGDTKGASMTWMDRSGNAFDQASLMIALLEQAATHNTEMTITNPRYVVGAIEPNQTEAWDWLGIPNDVAVARQILARGGLYGTVTDDGQGGIGTLELIHAWVKVTINSQAYEFDPSFKTRTNKSGGSYTEMNAALVYDRSVFNANAQVGATVEQNYPSYVEEVNQANINANLNTYSVNLTNYIKTNYPNGDLRDVIGGRRIQAIELSDLPPASLSYTVNSRDDEFSFSSMPDIYRTTLGIQYNGIDKTFLSSDIYGRRLSLAFNGSNQPQLILDGTPEATGSACAVGTAYNLALTVDHPYDSSDFDSTVTIPVKAGGFYAVVNGWGDTGKKILAQHRNALELHRYNGEGDNSEEVLGESYTLVGLTWLAQTSRMRQIAIQFGLNSYTDSYVVNHHMLGIAGHYDMPYLSVPLVHLGLSTSEDADERNAMFLSISDHAHAYQEQVIRQLQDVESVGAGRLIEMGNNAATYKRIFLANSSRWSSAQPYLYGYSQAEKDQITDYVNAGYDVSLPENGDLSVGSWTGSGFKAFNLTGSTLCAAYVIGDQYQGGSGTDSGAVNAAELYARSDVPAMRSSEGAHAHAHTDLTIGNGGLPFGLSFSRQYSSARRLQDSPVGRGWTHNLDISATVLSDSFQSLGDDSALDAVPHIVSLYVNWDLHNTYHSNLKTVVSTLGQAWLLDQLTDNLATIRQGAGRMHFVKGPDGSYREPTGTSIKLEAQGSQTFRLKDSRGKFYNFNADGTLDQWSDVFGNVVDFGYDGGKLDSVSSKIGGGSEYRKLILTYDVNNRISSVTDSATPSRSISLGYDGKGQLTSYTNPDGNTATYGYDATNDGRMTKLFIPTDQVNPFQTTVYDALGRVKQRVNALGTTWDYFLAGFRAEILEPAQTDPDNVTQRFSTVTWLNRFGLPILSIDQLGRETSAEYDGLFRPTQVTGATGMSSEYEYDENHSVIQTSSLAKSGSLPDDPNTHSLFGYTSFETANERWFLLNTYSTDSSGFRITHEYDNSNGNLIKSTLPEVDTPTGPATPEISYTYNAYGQIATQTDPNGMVTKYEYFLPSEGAGLKKTTVDDGGLDLTAELTYDTVGNVITAKDPKGNISHSEYFPSRRLKKTTAPSPFSYETTYEYNASGWPLHVKQQTAEGLIYHQSTTYTAAGQKATVKGPYKSGDDQGINLTTFTYDDLGRTWKVKDAENNTTETRYYPDGRVWKVIDAEGHDVVTNTYNDDGSLQKVVDAKGNATQYEYNGFMGLKKTIYADGTYTEPGYDPMRRMQTLRTRAGDLIGVEFDSMQRVKNKYIGLQSVSKEARLQQALDMGWSVSCSGDSDWWPVDDTARSGWIKGYESSRMEVTVTGPGTVSFQWKVSSQPDKDVLKFSIEGVQQDQISGEVDWQTKSYAIGSGSYVLTWEYFKDGDDFSGSDCGWVNWIHGLASTPPEPDLSPDNEIAYLYDINSQLIEVTDNAGTITNTYDALGRLTQTNDAHSKVMAYEYDDNSRRTKLTYPDSSYITYEYDQLNRPTAIKDASQTTLSQYTYDERSRCTNVTYANGTSLQAQYDIANRLLSLNNSTDTDNHKYAYTYDKVGNRQSMTVNDTEQHSYTYDDIYQITNVDYPAGYAYLSEDTQFNYDDAGNRSTVIESTTPSYTAPYVTNALNQYTSVDSVLYEYDDNGNITDDGDFNYSYDVENRLVGVTPLAGGPPPPDDTTAPTPDPMTWATAPNATGSTSITMTASTATDTSGVEYFFDCTTVGGNDSGWQDSPTYTDINLSAGTQYSYRVQARDKSSTPNLTGWSQTLSATTDSGAGGGSDPNLIAHWQFDETSGTTAADSSGNGHTGTLNNGAAFVSGVFGNGVQFDGVDDYVNIGNDSGLNLGTDDITLALWVNTTDDLGSVLAKNTGDTVGYKYRVRSGWGGSSLAWFQDGSSGAGSQYSYASVDVTDGNWHHVSAVLNRTAGTIRMYVDGTDCSAPVRTAPSGSLSNTANLYIGSSEFAGTLDEVRIYDRALSAAEIATLASTSPPPDDTTAPTPDPMTWATAPNATGSTSITMTASTATDTSGVEYFFDCTAGGGHDSTWQDSPTYTDINLSASTQYSYRVQARDKSANQNATGWSSTLSATTASGGTDPNLIAHWQFDETGGTTAADSSGNGHTGTLNDDASFVAGMYGNAVAFDGASDYITVSDSAAWDFSGKETTLALWFKADPTQPSEWTKLAEHRAGGQSTEGWYWGFDAAGDNMVFYAISVGGTDHAWITSALTYNDGTWHHATVTLADGIAKLYMDGAFLLQDTYDPLSDEDDALVIGGRSSLNGQIDELRIYDRALSAAEIATLASTSPPPDDTTAPTPDPMTWATAPNATGSTSITMTATTAQDTSGVEYYFYCTTAGGNDSGWQDSPTYTDINLQPSTQYTYQVRARDKSSNQNLTSVPLTTASATTDSGGGGSDPNLIAHWKFDETSGSIAADSSGNGHTGTLNGDASFVAGMYGNAAAFDGASDYITVSDSAAWDFSGKETTLALWFKADPTQPSAWAKLAEHRVGGQSTEGWFWGFDAAGESIVFHAISVGGTDHAWIEPSSTYDDGTWHHATVTLADGMAKLYVDGAFLLQDTYDPLSDEDDVLVIGGRSSLNGQIDELRIYDRALSAAEIATLAGVPDPEPDPIQGTSDWSNVSYTYDAAGRRITKDVDGEITKYIYDGDHVIAEYDGNDNLLRKFIYGPGTDNPVCMIEAAESNAKYYYHRDGLGNVIALSDDAGDTVQTYEYTVYGQVAASDPNHPNPYMFTGRRYDAETGLYYYRARMYNPFIGRFLQTDPIGYSDGINWYAYCGNNPGNSIDPSGLRRSPSSGLSYVYDARVGDFYELSDDPEVWVNGIQNTWTWNKDEIASSWMIHPDKMIETDFLGWGSVYVIPEGAGYEYYHPEGGYVTAGRSSLIFGGVESVSPSVSYASGDEYPTTFWGSAGYFLGGAVVAAGKGAAATVDGIIPGGDPLDFLYTNAYGGIDQVYVWSRGAGGIARDLGIMAFSSPGMIAQYVRHPVAYELGSIAMTNANYTKYGLAGLSAVQKGEALLLAHNGSYFQVLRLTNMAKGVGLLKTGFTPGGGALVVGALRATDD